MSAPVRVAYASNFAADGASVVKDVYGQSVLLTRTSGTAFVAHLLPAGTTAVDASAPPPPNARPLPVHRDVDGALWVTVPVPTTGNTTGSQGGSQPSAPGGSKLDGAAAAADPAAAAAAALAAAGPMPTPLAPLGGCDRKFVPPSPQKPPDFAAEAGFAPDADARRALLGVPTGSQGGLGSQGAAGFGSQSQPMSPDGGPGAAGRGAANPAAASSLHRLPPSARASPVAIKPSPFKERVDAATAAVVRKQRSLFQGPASCGATAEAAAAVAGAKVAAPPAPLPSRDRGIGGIPGSQEVPDV